MHLLSLPAPVGSHHTDLLMRLKRYHNQLNTPGRISNCYIITSIGAVNPFIGPYAKSAHFDTAASFGKRTGTLTGKHVHVQKLFLWKYARFNAQTVIHAQTHEHIHPPTHTHTYKLLSTDRLVCSSIPSCWAKHSVTLTVWLYLMIGGYDLAYLTQLVTGLQVHTHARTIHWHAD